MTAAVTAELGVGSAPANAGLSQRLRTISPERAAVTTRLLGAGDRLLREDGDARLELRPNVAQQAPHATAVELSHAHGRISLILTGEHGSAAIGDRTWHDFAGDARLLAWALAYEHLLARLSDLLGTPLLPVELLPAPRAAADVWHWIEFRYTQGEQRQCEGLLGLDRATTEALAAANGWQRGGAADSRIEHDDVPLPCSLTLPALFLPAATLRGLARDDVVLLGVRESILSALRLRTDTGRPSIDVRHAWIVAATHEGIAVSRALTQAELRNDTMSQDIPAAEPADDATPDIRDTIPIRVELVLDTLNLSLGELDRVGAGQILNLRQPVESASVTLRANGKVFGRGELVSLGEVLGVKVTRIGDDRGLQ